MYFSLESAGFTNIQPEPLYDLPSGDERRGKIESVVIEGKSDFARGDIFPKDTLIAITYHMEKGENPAYQVLNESLPQEMAQRAVITAMTNCQATDVFTADGSAYDTSKFHKYSDIDGFFLTVGHEGEWTAADEATWRVDDMLLNIFGYDTAIEVSCNVKMDGDSYIVFNVDKTVGTIENIGAGNSDMLYTEHLEPSDFNSFLTVPSHLIEADRDDDQVTDMIVENAERQEWIENQFSWWDGRHVELSELIKDSLNDSRSFDAAEASYIDVSDVSAQQTVNDTLASAGLSHRAELGDLFVIQEFTAKNIFDATVKSTAFGIVRENGEVLLIGIV